VSIQHSFHLLFIQQHHFLLHILFSFLRWTTKISDNNQSCTPYVTFIKNSVKVSRIIFAWVEKEKNQISKLRLQGEKAHVLKLSIVGKMRRFFISLMAFMRRNVVTKLLLRTENVKWEFSWLNSILWISGFLNLKLSWKCLVIEFWVLMNTSKSI